MSTVDIEAQFKELKALERKHQAERKRKLLSLGLDSSSGTDHMGGSSSGTAVGPKLPRRLIGQPIQKIFPRYGHFIGRVESFDASSRQFTVEYEDGEQKETCLSNLKPHLLSYQLPRAVEEETGQKTLTREGESQKRDSDVAVFREKTPGSLNPTP
jgi:hypothetical protein